MVARLRWRIYAESLWSPAVSELAAARIPPHLHGQDRIEFHKRRSAAAELLALLFPADEE